MPKTKQKSSDSADSLHRAGSVTRGLKYITNSPPHEHGGFHPATVETATTALKEIRRLRSAVKWALGEVGDFQPRPIGAGAYWWRTELRRRAGMSPSDLEYCCVQILKGKFWCDAGHDLQVIFEILAEKKLMDCNEHGQMVEVTPNAAGEPCDK